MCAMEQIDVLDKLCSGMRHTPIGHESVVPHQQCLLNKVS